MEGEWRRKLREELEEAMAGRRKLREKGGAMEAGSNGEREGGSNGERREGAI